MTFSRTLIFAMVGGMAATPAYAKIEHTETEAPRFGPLIMQTQAPLQITGLTPLILDPFALTTNETDVFATGTMASIWANTPEYQFDYYHNQFMLGMLHALSDDINVGLWYQYRYTANNRLDGLTEKFHSVFGIDQNGRTNVDEDRFYIYVPEYQSTPSEDFIGDAVVNAVNLYAEHNVYSTDHHAFSVGTTLFFNRVGSGEFENTAFEQSLQLNYGFQQQKHKVAAMLSLVHRPDNQQHGIDLRNWGVNGGISYQYQWLKHHELIAEYLVSTGKAHDNHLTELTDIVHEFALGYRYLFGNSAIELGALENMFNHDNSSDIVFSASFRHRLTL
ncbi:hypothetical protein BCT30_09210 [Enterovibrio norvegicus]|uniref:DUF3187 family protein n=1 Tax=Enterovibrio norvegicus TaxID=188144 RepID=UPI000C8511B1|nr:DUF3187 family protein [Enterovibrio norvegicus]MCC4800204.1 DUF3187 family protein [Enterovibrio norvegicus]PMH71719.1 hypothetical protein BCU62_04155 [Enterovibrio norvegicus]PMI35438.1 hypothetical protein BCU47_00270 [Enterovibrio norvegicus]PMI38116.1 hypothetical protein BCU46_07990 [Enterovibrio norvegicus]PMN55535.1 hypothetical protein BCT30_09210 [Enterovibrio norvegicus]